MEVKIRHAYTLRPTPEQAEQIDFFCGCARFAYNALLADVKAQLEETGRFDIMSSVELKAEHPFLKKADKYIVDNARIQLTTAVKNWSAFKKGIRKGKIVGFPTFHKKDGREDSYTTNNTHNNATGHDSIRIEDGGVRLPKIKEPVPIVLDRPFPKGATIHYKISFCLHYDLETLSRPFEGVEKLRVIGLDMSLNEFAVSSDPEERTHGTYVKQNRRFRRRLARLQRRVSRKKLVPTGATYYSRKWQKDAPAKVRSKNREKARRRHARLSQRIANRRKDFVVKLARYYAMNYDVIVLEDLDMRAMSRSLRLGKSVMDLGFGEFKRWLEWECLKLGSVVVYANKWFPSSKTCSSCGHVHKELSLGDRRWTCPSCGAEHDRDVNAARNLRGYFFQQWEAVPKERRERLTKTPVRRGLAPRGAGSNPPETRASAGWLSVREAVLQVLSPKQELRGSPREAPSFRKG